MLVGFWSALWRDLFAASEVRKHWEGVRVRDLDRLQEMRPSIEKLQEVLDDSGHLDQVRPRVAAFVGGLGEEGHFEDPHLDRYRGMLKAAMDEVMECEEEDFRARLSTAEYSIWSFWNAVTLTLRWWHPDFEFDAKPDRK